MKKREETFLPKMISLTRSASETRPLTKLLVFKLARLGRLDGLIVRVHGLLQLEPQVLPVHPKGLDLALPLFLSLPQPLILLGQANIFKAALLGRCRRLEISHESAWAHPFFQFLLKHRQRNGDR